MPLIGLVDLERIGRTHFHSLVMSLPPYMVSIKDFGKELGGKIHGFLIGTAGLHLLSEHITLPSCSRSTLVHPLRPETMC